MLSIFSSPPPRSFPPSLPRPYVKRNPQLLGTFCPSASEQLEYQSPDVCIHMCVCFLWAHPMCAKILIACSCFLWVYTAGLCVCISRIFLCDSWGSMYACIGVSVLACAGAIILIVPICFLWRNTVALCVSFCLCNHEGLFIDSPVSKHLCYCVQSCKCTHVDDSEFVWCFCLTY